jgi:integrase
LQAEERLSEFVFTDTAGQILDGVAVTRSSFYPLLKRARLPQIRFHDLRHTTATLLLEAGVHPIIVAQRLGHSTPSLVMNTYGHVTPRMQEQATAALGAILHA